jgi:hypothetical protein
MGVQALGVLGPTGEVKTRAIRKVRNEGFGPGRELTVKEILQYGAPNRECSEEVNRWRRHNTANLFRGVRRVLAARALNLPTLYGQLYIRVHRAKTGLWVPYGLASMRVVTSAGVNFIVDGFQNLVELENMKFHGIGTGSTAEASGDTALVTELTTQYNPDSTRATGTTTEGASANIYRTVGTNAVDATVNLREHGVFTQAATGDGTLLDRSLFAGINLDSGDSIETTYELTVVAGG